MVRKDTAKRKQSEHDEMDVFQRTMATMVEFISRNRRYFIVAGTAVLVVVIVIAGYFWHRVNNERAAGALYAEAFSVSSAAAESGNNADIDNARGLYEELAEEYPETASGVLARNHLGNIYYKTGETDKAIASYQEFLDSVSNAHPLRPLVYNSLGYCYEEEGDTVEAIDAFLTAAELFSGGELEQYCLRDAARLYEERGDTEKARMYYEKILDTTEEPLLQKIIKRKIAMLENK